MKPPRKCGAIISSAPKSLWILCFTESVSQASATQVRARIVLYAKTHPTTTSSVIAYLVSPEKHARQNWICVRVIRANTVENASTW